MRARKLLKSLSLNLITLLALGGLLTLPACRSLNPFGGQSSPKSIPASFNFPLALKWQRDLDCGSVLPAQAWRETLGVPVDYLVCSGQLYALDIQSGAILWQKGNDGFMASPWTWIGQQDKLIVGGDDGVQVLDIHTGEILWSAPSFSQVFNVVYGEGKVFVRIDRSTFRAYELETGQVLWQSSVEHQSTIYYDARNQLLVTFPGTYPGNYNWLDPGSGELLRTAPSQVPATSMPTGGALVENGKLYFGALILDAATATPVCMHSEYNGALEVGNEDYDLVLIDNVLYISTWTSVVAFDTILCQPQWEYQPQAKLGRQRPEVVSNPAVLNGVVYAIFSDATLRAVDQQSGQEIGSWQAEAVKYSRSTMVAVPGVAASGDTLIASFGNGQLFAFGP